MFTLIDKAPSDFYTFPFIAVFDNRGRIRTIRNHKKGLFFNLQS